MGYGFDSCFSRSMKYLPRRAKFEAQSSSVRIQATETSASVSQGPLEAYFELKRSRAKSVFRMQWNHLRPLSRRWKAWEPASLGSSMRRSGNLAWIGTGMSWFLRQRTEMWVSTLTTRRMGPRSHKGDFYRRFSSSSRLDGKIRCATFNV